MDSNHTIKFYWITEDVKPKDQDELRKTYVLAYQAVSKDAGMNMRIPKMIQIRSKSHPTTFTQGQHKTDPDGWHYTICYKAEGDIESGKHLTVHAYTSGPGSFEIREVKQGNIKKDTVPKSNGKDAWPAESEMYFGAEISVADLEK